MPPHQEVSYCLIFFVRKFKDTPGSSHQVLWLQDCFSSSLANEAGGPPQPRTRPVTAGSPWGTVPGCHTCPVSIFLGPCAVPSPAAGGGLLLSCQVLDSVSEEAHQHPASRDALTPPLPTQEHGSVPWATDTQRADVASHQKGNVTAKACLIDLRACKNHLERTPLWASG